MKHFFIFQRNKSWDSSHLFHLFPFIHSFPFDGKQIKGRETGIYIETSSTSPTILV